MTKEQLGNLIIASEDTMYHVAKTLLRSDADCADAIQEAIVKAFASFETLRKDAYAKTWLVRIVINECYAIRLTVTLYYIEGYSVREIAALMDTTESAVKNRLARARDKMRKELAG